MGSSREYGTAVNRERSLYLTRHQRDICQNKTEDLPECHTKYRPVSKDPLYSASRIPDHLYFYDGVLSKRHSPCGGQERCKAR